MNHDPKTPVVVAMSGGVDSAAAALSLVEQGYKVIGVSMQVWDYRNKGGALSKTTCCAPADFEDARRVAEVGGFPYYVFDFENNFRKKVIDPFIESYLNGKTPNPCINCNTMVKFYELRKRAQSLGVAFLATGHYAKIRCENDKFALFTASDEKKDQSYFLYQMTQRDLSSTFFPIGGMKKSEVRDFLSQRGIECAKKAESQDICFISGKVGDFISKQINGKSKKGKLVNSKGELLGEHGGIHNFTIGQRRGLGLSNPSPLYVLSIDPKTKTVIVGEKSELEKKEFCVKEVNWICGDVPDNPITALVKLRYRQEGISCRLIFLSKQKIQVEFLSDWSSVCPGQSAVFYSLEKTADGSRKVYGGGIIVRDEEI